MAAPRSRPGMPWRVTEFLALASAVATASVGLLVSYLGASSQASTRPQFLWLAGGVGALVVAGVAIMFWLLLGLRAVRLRQREVVARIESGLLRPRATKPVAYSARYVFVQGMKRYHVPGCALVTGRATSETSLAVHRRAGRVPCGICQATTGELVSA